MSFPPLVLFRPFHVNLLSNSKRVNHMKYCLLFLLYTSNAMAFSLWDMSPYEVRELIDREICAIEADQPVVGDVQDITISRDGRMTALRIYSPQVPKESPIVLLIHGGAWVAGSIETHDNMARLYLQRRGSVGDFSGIPNCSRSQISGCA